MEIILKEDIEKLGNAGEKVKVTGGYARNYLIPQGLALPATSSNLGVMEEHMKRRAKKLAAAKSQAEAMAAELGKLHLVFTRKAGEEGKLFGSVTPGEIGKQVVEKGFEIDRRKVLLDMPIKSVGEHKIGIKVHPEVTAEIMVEIKAEQEEQPIAVEEEKSSEADEESNTTEEPETTDK